MSRSLFPILAVMFVNVINFTIMIPVLPFIVNQYGGNPIIYGALIAIYPAFQFIGAPLLGSLSDIHGRRPILLISQLGTLLSWCIFALAYFMPQHHQLFTLGLPLYIIALARITDGITGGNNSVANAYIVDKTEPHERTKIFGLIGAAIGIALMVGPAIGGWTGTLPIGYLGTIIAAIVISLATLILMYRYLPESLDPQHRVKPSNTHPLQQLNLVKKFNRFKHNRLVINLFHIRLFYALCFSSYTSIVVLFIIDRFTLSQSQIGLLFFLLGIFFVFNQSIMVKQTAHRFGDVTTFFIGQITLCVGLILIPITATVWIYLPIAYLINLGFALSFPTFKALLTHSVDRSRQGEVTGLDESILALASATAPVFAGLIYARLSVYAFPLFTILVIIPHIYRFFKTTSFSLNGGQPAQLSTVKSN